MELARTQEHDAARDWETELFHDRLFGGVQIFQEFRLDEELPLLWTHAPVDDGDDGEIRRQSPTGLRDVPPTHGEVVECLEFRDATGPRLFGEAFFLRRIRCFDLQLRGDGL